jgi:hypothetical protein
MDVSPMIEVGVAARHYLRVLIVYASVIKDDDPRENPETI